MNHRRYHLSGARLMKSVLGLIVLLLCTATHADVIVATDGSGQHMTVQAAIDAVPDGAKDRTVIVIKPGTYKERLVVPKTKGPITFRGEGRDAAAVVLTYDLWAQAKVDGKEVGTT